MEKCLPYKHKDLSPNLRAYVKSEAWWFTFIIPEMGRLRQEDSWDSRAIESGLIEPASLPLRVVSPKTRRTAPKE